MRTILVLVIVSVFISGGCGYDYSFSLTGKDDKPSEDPPGNQPPVISHISPGAGLVFVPGEMIDFSAHASDDADPATDLATQWLSDKDGVLDTTDPDALGNFGFSSSSLSYNIHYITIRAFDRDGAVGLAVFVCDNAGLPPVILGFTQDANGVHLTWSQAPTNHFDSYEIYRSTLPAPVSSGILLASQLNPLSIQFDDLTAIEGVTYYYQVVTSNSLGHSSVSNEIIALLPFFPPAAAIAMPSDGQEIGQGQTIQFQGVVSDRFDNSEDLNIEWSSNLDGVLNSDAPNAGGTVEFFLSGLSYDIHTITLLVTDSHGLSDQTSIVVNNILPPHPTLALVRYSDRIDLSWAQAPTENFDRYDVYRAVTPGLGTGGTLLSTITDPSNASFSDTTVIPTERYYYHIESYNTFGKNAAGNEVEVLFDLLPPGVTINSPATGAAFAPGDLISFSGSATDEYDDVSTLTIEWSSDKDGIINTDAPDGSGNMAFDLSSLSYDIHLITLTATDSDGMVSQDSITVDNVVPPGVFLSVSPAGPDNDLTWTGTLPAHFASYTVYRSYAMGTGQAGELLATIAASGVTTYQDSSWVAGALPVYQVFVTNTFGYSTGSNEVCAYAVGTPDRVDLNVLLGALLPGPGPSSVLVADQTNNRIMVIEGTTGLVGNQVAVGLAPQGMALDPPNDRLYVANSGENTISVVDTAAMVEIRKIGIPQRPARLAYDPGNGYLYVTCKDFDYPLIVDAADDCAALIDTHYMGPSYGASGLMGGFALVDGTRKELWFLGAGGIAANLFQLDIAGSFPWVKNADWGAASYPKDATLSPDGETIYIIGDSRILLGFDSYRLKVSRTYNLGVYGKSVAITPGGRLLFAGPGDDSVWVLDAVSADRCNAFSVGDNIPAEGLGVSLDGQFLFARVADPGGGEDLVIQPIPPYTVNAPRLEATPHEDRVELEWTIPSMGGLDTYYLYRSNTEGTGTSGDLLSIITPIGSTSYSDSTVNTDSTYVYQLFTGVGSTLFCKSNEVSVEVTGDPAPVELALSQVGTDVQLSWSLSGSATFTSYEIYRDTERGPTNYGTLLATETNINSTGYTDSTASPETVYYYQVVVVNANGDRMDSNDPGINVRPDIPSPVPITQELAPTGILLQWDESLNPHFDSYRIYRSLTPGQGVGGTLVASVSIQEITSFIDTTITDHNIYYYQLFVFDRDGDSAGSNEESAIFYEPARKVSLPEDAFHVIVSPDSSTVFTSVPDLDRVYAIDIATAGVSSYIDLPSRPLGMAIDQASNKLYVALRDSNKIAPVDIGSLTVETQFSAGGDPILLALHSPSNKIVVTNRNDYPNIFNLPAGTHAGKLDFHPNYYFCAADTAGPYVYLAGSGSSGSYALQYDFSSPTPNLTGQYSLGLYAWGAALSNDNTTFYASTGMVRGFPAADFNSPTVLLFPETVLSMAFSKDNNLFYTADGDPKIIVFRVADLAQIQTVSTEDSLDTTTFLTTSPDGRWLCGVGRYECIYIFKVGD